MAEDFDPYEREIRHNAKNLDTKEVTSYVYTRVTFDVVHIRKILVANIPEEATHKEVKQLFINTAKGKISDCILKKKKPGSKQFAFITFEDFNDARLARVAGLKRKYRLHNQYLRVLPAYSWNQPDNKFEDHKKITNEDEHYIEELQQLGKVKLSYDPFDNGITIDCLDYYCLGTIFSFLPIIDRIRIERVCKKWQSAVKESWPSFKKLDIRKSTWFAPNKPKPNPSRNPLLNLFDDEYSNKITTPMIYQLLKRCGQYLTEIDLSDEVGQTELATAVVIIIAKCCPNIQSINLSGLDVRSSGFKGMAKNLSNLKTLIITNHKKEVVDIDFLESIDALAKLLMKNKIERLEIDSKFLEGKLGSLLKLSGKTIKNIFVKDLQPPHGFYYLDEVLRFKNLNELRVSVRQSDLKPTFFTSSKLNNELKVLEFFCEPERIRFFWTDEDNVDNRSINVDSSLLKIKNFVNLEKLNFSGIEIVNDAFLITVSDYCKQLLFIDISYCKAVTDEGILAITRLNELKVFKCKHCNINEISLIELVKTSENLEKLDVTSCPFISAGFIKSVEQVINIKKNKKIFELYTDLNDVQEINSILLKVIMM